VYFWGGSTASNQSRHQRHRHQRQQRRHRHDQRHADLRERRPVPDRLEPRHAAVLPRPDRRGDERHQRAGRADADRDVHRQQLGHVSTLQVGTFLSSIAPVPAGKYAISYQSRIVQANVAQANASTGAIEYNPTRVMWSKLQSEITGSQYSGDQVLYPFALAQQYNYVDFPSARSITGLAAAGENQLIVFSDRATFRITGTLDSESVANAAFDFSAGQVSANVGCIDAGSIQYTKGGLVFAAYDNIYQFDGAAMRPLLTGRTCATTRA
jgi:hypothetical protein